MPILPPSPYRSLRFRLHTWLGGLPWLLYPLYALTGRHRSFVVRRDSELVIEGFARSASTFVWYAVQHAQGRPCRIAAHLHVPAQIVRAVRWGLPTLVLIREPEAAVRSAMLREPDIPAAAFLARYRSFYRVAERHRQRLVIVDFVYAVADVGAAIEAVNARFGTRFPRFVATPAALAAVNAQLDARLQSIGGGPLASYRPNPAKEAAKRSIDLSGAAAQLADCRALYRRLSPRGANPVARS